MNWILDSLNVVPAFFGLLAGKERPHVSQVLLKDLITEILSRLPVKTLMRFKAVCKTWKEIISSSYFERQHFGHKGHRTDLLVGWTGIAAFPDDTISVDSVSLFPYETLESPGVELGKGVFEEAVDGVSGPCHGILCVCFRYNTFALWNPATRKLWPIPKSPLLSKFRSPLFSFWIDPLTNEFKVFCVVQDRRKSTKPLFFMYTSCNDSWKELEAPFYPGDRVSNRQCFRYSVSNGLYYFHKSWDTSCHTIIAYDIFKDLFQEIPIPMIGFSGNKKIVLDLLGDSLALFAAENVNYKARTEIWVMKEKGCWTKLFDGFILVDKHGIYEPLGFWNRKEIFVYCYPRNVPHICELMIYDLVSGKARKILVEESECFQGVFCASFFPLSYNESLIQLR